MLWYSKIKIVRLLKSKYTICACQYILLNKLQDLHNIWPLWRWQFSQSFFRKYRCLPPHFHRDIATRVSYKISRSSFLQFCDKFAPKVLSSDIFPVLYLPLCSSVEHKLSSRIDGIEIHLYSNPWLYQSNKAHEWETVQFHIDPRSDCQLFRTALFKVIRKHAHRSE